MFIRSNTVRIRLPALLGSKPSKDLIDLGIKEEMRNYDRDTSNSPDNIQTDRPLLTTDLYISGDRITTANREW